MNVSRLPTRKQNLYAQTHPCGLKDVNKLGQVKDRMKLKHQVVAVAHDIPTSLTCTY